MIENIRLGTKISTRNFNFIPQIYANQDLIDYIEIIIMPEFTSADIDVISNLKIPYAIHVPNIFYGIDFGNINKNEKNIEYINKINKYKNQLRPICCIVHPESGDLELSIENIKKVDIKPVALENMTLKSLLGGELIGYDPESLKEYFIKISDLEFCLDINHAIKAAISKKIDYLSFIKDFLSFKNPILYHISGGTMNVEVDEHLPLEKSQYNLSEIKKILLNHNSIVNLTLETPKDYEKGIEDDLQNIKFFLNT